MHCDPKDRKELIDELVDDWTPEPLVAPPTAHEELDNEKRPVIVGYVPSHTTSFKYTLIY